MLRGDIITSVILKSFLAILLFLYPTIIGNFDVSRYKSIPKEEYFLNSCLENVDCVLLTEMGYYEARGESDSGIAAVMFVVINRKNSKMWPGSVKGVIEQDNQFSYKTDGQMKKGFAEKEQYDRILVIAGKVVSGAIHSPVGEATHYHTISIKVPKWAKKKRKVATIGEHVFYE